MKTIYYLSILIFLICCKTNGNSSDIMLKETDNKTEYVKIYSDIFKKNEDSLIIDIPIEYEILNNSDKDITGCSILMSENGKMLINLTDYYVYDLNNKGSHIIHKLDIPQKAKKNLIVHRSTMKISKKDVRKLFTGYKENSIDTIKLSQSSVFRKENRELMNLFNKNNDSIVVNLFNKNQLLTSFRKKIAW